MSQSSTVNRRIVLHSRPVGAPTPDNFRLEEIAVAAPESGQVLLRTLYLSLDPYMRGRMSDGPSYAAPVAIGGVMVGSTVSRVEASAHAGFEPGDLVLGYSGWQHYALSDGTDLAKLDASMAHPSMALGALGMPAFTAYMGLLDIGQPKAGETVVVAAASGAVGSVVGQIARLEGCRVVGIAGGADKCSYVVSELGFDACIDRRGADFAVRLAMACPKGIDVYFDNVGGPVLDAVLGHMNAFSRIALCGLISGYSNPDALAVKNFRSFLVNRIQLRGFICSDHLDLWKPALKELGALVHEGRLKYRESIAHGIENAPAAFIGLLHGQNFGKQLVKLV